MYAEDDLIPISALQHVLYCERQFALIHLEQQWEENRYTAEGRVLHEKVDLEHHESRRLFRQEFGMAVRSLTLGLVGKCDLVELYLKPDGSIATAIPVEFKRGRDKEKDWDRVQLCAEALCLEEMLGTPAERGDFYYLAAHRRTHVEFASELFGTVRSALYRAREILESGKTPAARYSQAQCDRCSLLDICMPTSAGSGDKTVARYIQSQLASIRRNNPIA